jgi:hypothetical protein
MFDMKLIIVFYWRFVLSNFKLHMNLKKIVLRKYILGETTTKLFFL